ncbi:MAG: EAL domain-containing protein [Thiotrichales bacterium]|nr:EAL domain-containing protein [Thiotrichales bacterium]
MSLVKQLWIAIIGLMILVFLSSFFISTYSAKSYYIEQLSLKNSDNANSLAQMLSQMDKDETLIELLIAAQFDIGNYKRIELLTPNGEQRLLKIHEGAAQAQSVPQWFQALVSLQVEPGIAGVQDGWQQYGTLVVESDDRFAYQSLWKTTLQFLGWFFLSALLLGAVGSWVLRILTQPLEEVVLQAEAIGGRRFITSKEPKTLEFNRLVRAMNTLSERVRTMLENESRRLEELRLKSQHDPLTGLAKREFFFGKMEAVLQDDDPHAQNLMLLVRLSDLQKINQALGHAKTDALLKGLANQLKQALEAQTKHFDESIIGRLGGADFAVILTQVEALSTWAQGLEVFLANYLKTYRTQVDLQLPMAAITFNSDDSRQNLLQKLDGLLVRAANELQAGEHPRGILLLSAESEQAPSLVQDAQAWQHLLDAALAQDAIYAQLFPVVDVKNRLLHYEAMMRLRWQDKILSAGELMPWARRFERLPHLDLALCRWLLAQMQSGDIPGTVAMNLTMETLKSLAIRDELVSLIQQSGLGPRVCLELPEHAVLQALPYFMDFCEQLKPLGVKIGLDKGGAGFTNIPRLQEVGLDYIKLDRTLIQNLANQDEQTTGFVRGVCTLGHSIGLELIAEGMQTFSELSALEAVGLDGATGPGVPMQTRG